MDWPEDVAAELPAPRDDEPTSLRQDIADELSDHLHCAFNRELHATPDESQAQRNVLSRFGDPSRVARRLWFDAMKERIMSQRITMIMSCVLAVACLVAVGLVWRIASQSQQVNLAILDKLNAFAAQPPVKTAESLGWLPLKIRLVPDDKGSKPPEVHSVTLVGNVHGRGMRQVDKKVGPEGIVDFGLVHAEYYDLNVMMTWGESLRQDIPVLPGGSETVEIVCPSAAPQDVQIALSVQWPDELREKGLWLKCHFSPAPKSIDGRRWSVSDSFGGHYLIFSPSGELFEHNPTLSSSGLPEDVMVREGRVLDGASKPLETQTVLRWKGTGFNLSGISIMQPQSKAPPEGETAEEQRLSSLGDHFLNVDSNGEVPEFRAKPGELNRWTITLPPELVEQLREKLTESQRKRD